MGRVTPAHVHCGIHISGCKTRKGRHKTDIESHLSALERPGKHPAQYGPSKEAYLPQALLLRTVYAKIAAEPVTLGYIQYTRFTRPHGCLPPVEAEPEWEHDINFFLGGSGARMKKRTLGMGEWRFFICY